MTEVCDYCLPRLICFTCISRCVKTAQMLKMTVGLPIKMCKFVAYHLVKYKFDNTLFYKPRQKLLTLYVLHGIGVGNEFEYYLISERYGFSSHMQLGCMFNSFSRLTPKKTSKLHIIGILWKDSQTGRPPSKRVNYAEAVFTSLHPHVPWKCDFMEHHLMEHGFINSLLL